MGSLNMTEKGFGFIITVIDIILYYGGLLNNANVNKVLSFEGPEVSVKDDDDDNDEDFVDEIAINGEDFVNKDEYEERIERGDFERDIDDDEIEPKVHDDEIFDRGEIDTDNIISVQNITNTIPVYTPPALSFSANT
ncbi:hypothetical protein SO802_012361 [Lithocarpus litseifolius]|uniref:Uncharacterized protein n=1 Tax=Lithocarpus litseifolius TaxID=425828 RepID=A0AAW2D2J9_9ROSI